MPDLYRFDKVAEDSIVAVLKDITGTETVMWDKQDAFVSDTASVKPTNKDFITLSFLSGLTPTSELEYTPSTLGGVGLFDMSMAYRFTISVNLYTNNAHMFKVAKIQAHMRSEKNTIVLKTAGLGYMGSSTISDFSEFEETRYNLRAHIDLSFSYIFSEKGINLGEIEQVSATGTLGNNNVSVNINKNKGIL